MQLYYFLIKITEIIYFVPETMTQVHIAQQKLMLHVGCTKHRQKDGGTEKNNEKRMEHILPMFEIACLK